MIGTPNDGRIVEVAMTFSATSSASSLMSSVRELYQSQFAAMKKQYKETGTVAGAQTSFTSDDGNVKLSIRGQVTSDGRQYLNLDYRMDGKEGETLARTLTGGIDNLTGLPFSADAQVGGGGMSAGAEITSDADFDALAKDYTNTVLETQDQTNAKINSWQYGDKTFSSLEDFQKFMRPQIAASNVINVLASKMTFSSSDEAIKFIKEKSDALAEHLRNGGDPSDLSEILKDVPKEALRATRAERQLTGSNNPFVGKLLEQIGGHLTNGVNAKSTNAAHHRVNLFA